MVDLYLIGRVIIGRRFVLLISRIELGFYWLCSEILREEWDYVDNFLFCVGVNLYFFYFLSFLNYLCEFFFVFFVFWLMVFSSFCWYSVFVFRLLYYLFWVLFFYFEYYWIE